jgi:heme-degrading monooxygenase HmoA
MHAVVNHLHFTRPAEDFVQPMLDEGIALLANMPGFRGVYYVKEADDRGIIILLWESLADAAHASKTFGSTWFNDRIFPYLASEQRRTVGEVLAYRVA